LIKYLASLLVMLALVVGCIPVIEPPPAAPNEPPIAEIDSISATTIAEGQTVTLMGHGTDIGGTVVAYSWRSDKDGILSASASFSTSKLSVGTHYIYFRVQDNKGAWSNQPYRIVNVLPPGTIKPLVNIFKVFPTTIVSGDSTTLSWDVSDAQTITISPGVGNVPTVGNRLLSPKITTYYTLTATNKAGSVTEELKVVVSELSDKTIELFSIPAEGGYVNSSREVGTDPQVGITKSLTPTQAFFSFDISMIPQGALITSASIDITDHIMYGHPFSMLGAMGIFAHQYGVLDANDYIVGFVMDTLAYTYQQPTGPYTSERLVSAIQQLVNTRNSRFQIRVQFEKFHYTPYATEKYYLMPYENEGNYLDFTHGKAKLVIQYK
jgi:hypothetical protein